MRTRKKLCILVFVLCSLLVLCTNTPGTPKINSSTSNLSPPNRKYVLTSDTNAIGRLRVFSQNILASSWITPRADLLPDLLWESRLERLFIEVEKRRPDIICLQEVEEAQFHSDIRPRALASGFEGVFSTKSGQPIGVAIFWSQAKFVAETAIHTDLTDASQSRWHFDIAFGFNENQINRYIRTARRTTLFVVLIPILNRHHGEKALVVATTHLIASVHTCPTNLDVQAFQAARTMEALDRVVAQQEARYQNVAVILTGDFNAPQYYPLSAFRALEEIINEASFELVSVEKFDTELPEDSIIYCIDWAAAGECEKNQAYMLVECAKSCAGASVPLEQRIQILCEHWASLGECRPATPRARSYCASVCKTKVFLDSEKDMKPSDLNTIIHSPVYELMTEGRLSENSIHFLIAAAKAAGLHPMSTLPFMIFQFNWGSRALKSAYAMALGAEPATCVQETLDFVFFSPSHGSLQLLGVLAPPEPPLDYAQSIKNFGTDHISLVVDFAMLPA